MFHNKPVYKSNNGFTLIEMAVTIALIGIIAIPTTQFFNAQMKSMHYERARQSYRSDFFPFIMKLRMEARQAEKKTMEIVDNNQANELKF